MATTHWAKAAALRHVEHSFSGRHHPNPELAADDGELHALMAADEVSQSRSC